MAFICLNNNFIGQTYMVCAVQPVQIFLALHNSCSGEFSHKTLHNHQFRRLHIGVAELSSFNNVTVSLDEWF
jgi:hypothetical protein